MTTKANTTTTITLHLPLNEIVVLPQPRRIFRDIELLADDIRLHGLLQPPTITPSKRLLMGERRYRACKLLGMESIDVLVCEKEMTDDEVLEVQVAENVARDDLSWQERALAMLEIHTKKSLRGALEGWTWGQRETCKLFKMELGTVNYILRVAYKLKLEEALPDEDRKYWNFTSANEAYRMGLLAEEEDRLQAILAKETQQNINREQGTLLTSYQEVNQPTTPGNGTSIAGQDIPQGSTVVSADAFAFERERYNSNPLNTIPFDDYWAERQASIRQSANIIYLSSRILCCDSITYMNDPNNENFFDHIITDIPFGIDVAMLDQQTTGITGIERTASAHEVEENLELHKRFFTAAFKCTKDKSYVVTFCDIMEFRTMVDLAEEAGFSAQRWPLIWPKTIAMNSAAHCNSTKNYEIALICHKPGATFINKMSSSFLPSASTADAKKLTGHVFAKPFEVTRAIVEAITMPGQRILEPFAGGGSMVIEMLRAGREVCAVEKAEHQYNALLENVKREYYAKLNPNFIFK